jgi:2'-5' RNA ligase
MGSETIRAFLAIELTDRMKAEAVQFVKPIQAEGKAFRFIDPKNWHLTLHFFGQSPLDDADRVRTSLEKTFKEVEPFSISLEGLCGFPNLSRPSLLWIGVAGNVGALDTLKQRMDRVLSTLNFPTEERKFHPHVTIARAKNRFLAMQPSPGYSFKGNVVDRVEHVTLFQSHLNPSGAEHIPLCQISLGSRP